MATEKTPLLKGYVITIPEKIYDLPICGDLMKGLSLEELMIFENDPWWQNLRRVAINVFWVIVFVIFAAACIIAVLEHGQGSCSLNGNPLKKAIVPAIQSSNGTNTTFQIAVGMGTPALAF